MKQNEVVGKETTVNETSEDSSDFNELIISGNHLENALDLMDHVLDFTEVEISLGSKIERARIGNLIKVVESFVNEAKERFFAAEKDLSERNPLSLTNNLNGGSAECPEG